MLVDCPVGHYPVLHLIKRSDLNILKYSPNELDIVLIPSLITELNKTLTGIHIIFAGESQFNWDKLYLIQTACSLSFPSSL